MIFNLMPLSTIDFPGVVSVVVFIHGCNFRCPFCHNPELVIGKPLDFLSETELLEEIARRRKLIDGVVVTGGEPLIHEDIVELLCSIKKLKVKIKLDTNGNFPERLSQIFKSKAIDYVAMDIKNSAEKYARTTGTNIDLPKILESIKLIENSGIAYEFRTTVVPGFHTVEDIEEISKMLKSTSQYCIQNFVRSKHVKEEGLPAKGFTRAELKVFEQAARKSLCNVGVR